jgi:hypothetical protein
MRTERQTDERTDGQADTTEMTVAFRYFAKAPKNSKIQKAARKGGHILTIPFFPVVQQSKLGLGRLRLEFSRSHSVRHTTLGMTPLDE